VVVVVLVMVVKFSDSDSDSDSDSLRRWVTGLRCWIQAKRQVGQHWTLLDERLRQKCFRFRC